ncbi:MAG: RNA polymerase sporulation sigma factor SigF [Lachnospiraceae bacterium]|jgi:RNA polymerase sporulation-specific sigma factor|nr:RNA polymerase sporulation sigma factor SigF [Lachnospiraceae bacterium]
MEDTIVLLERSHKGDKEAREELVEKNLGLVHHIVRRFAGRGYDMEDLFQIGSIGLLKAIDKFDLQYDVKFSTYAVPMIAGEIKRFLRDDGMIKMSRSLKETAMKARVAQEKLSHEKGREATLEEISKEIGMEMSDVVMALDANVEVESLYKTIYQGDGGDIYLMDKLKEERDGNEGVMNRMVIEGLLKNLDEKEREIIILRYFQDKTQSEIALALGISQVQVSRLEKRILRQMRERLL